MRSKVDTNLTVTKDHWVVSLVRDGYNHALIMVESMGYGESEEGLCIRWFDFLPYNDLTSSMMPNSRHVIHWATFFVTIKNPLMPGIVRYCPKNDEMPLINVVDTLTKRELFKQFNWNEDTDSWQCDAEKVKRMLADILADIEQGHLFQLKGGPVGLNCTTWGWEKLNIAGIDASNKNIRNRFAVMPNHNIGSKRHERCTIV